MDDYLSKPLRPHELDAALERWLGATPPPAAPAVHAADGEALVDETRMRVFRDDYPEIVEQLVDLFVDSTPPLLDDLRGALERDDTEAARRAAHKLKGSCQNIGATFMATLCLSLERDDVDAAATLAELDDAFASTEAALRRELTVA